MTGEIVAFDRAKIGDQAQTWKRADGEMIMGEYAFMTGPDGLDDTYDDPIEYVVQTWQLVAEHTVLIPEPREPDPDEDDDDELSLIPVPTAEEMEADAKADDEFKDAMDS